MIMQNQNSNDQIYIYFALRPFIIISNNQKREEKKRKKHGETGIIPPKYIYHIPKTKFLEKWTWFSLQSFWLFPSKF